MQHAIFHGKRQQQVANGKVLRNIFGNNLHIQLQRIELFKGNAQLPTHRLQHYIFRQRHPLVLAGFHAQSKDNVYVVWKVFVLPVVIILATPTKLAHQLLYNFTFVLLNKLSLPGGKQFIPRQQVQKGITI